MVVRRRMVCMIIVLLYGDLKRDLCSMLHLQINVCFSHFTLMIIDCPGTQSDDAGKSSACAGCPNQQICAEGLPKAPDPGQYANPFLWYFSCLLESQILYLS